MGDNLYYRIADFRHYFHIGKPTQSEEVTLMRYPKFMERVNMGGAVICGVIVFVFALLAVMESILRKFGHPTVWTLNLTQSVFIWAAFLGSSWAFQEHGHVAVDLVRDLVDKHTKRRDRLPRRIMAVIGYICAFVVVFVLLYGGWIQTANAIATNQMEPYVFRLPHVVSTLPVVIGSIQMLATLIFMILDLFAGGEKFM
jgi:TRAP-type C4-dicarboxylate transport system permease small subunit